MRNDERSGQEFETGYPAGRRFFQLGSERRADTPVLKRPPDPPQDFDEVGAVSV